MPSLKGRAGHLKLLGSLALGDTLSLEVEIVLEHVGPLEAVPELVTIDMVMVRKTIPVPIATSPCKPSSNDQ
jgi:hypothetical protein